MFNSRDPSNLFSTEEIPRIGDIIDRHVGDATGDSMGFEWFEEICNCVSMGVRQVLEPAEADRPFVKLVSE